MSNVCNDKFKNLVLYVLSHEDYREGGIKKLNKLLYFIDFYFYRDHEELISNVDYAKADMGPVVDGYKTIFSALAEDGVIEQVSNVGFVAYKANQAPDLSDFSSDEIAHIGRVLDQYGKLAWSDLELISHQQQPWVLTESMGDKIDPDLALLIADSDNEDVEVQNQDLKNELIDLANSV